ncbi:hypothetical protein [Pseudomonas putida]|uniref:hypothetical protein n=1 Tax=Pseudomonas putida TaxID=303 RepID=UPI000281F7BA|nr:hypothetical protein [Pseudomonas putida]EMR46729.1 hypothetical protein PPUTLS46_015884 [Pseudomonas putida LS46]
MKMKWVLLCCLVLFVNISFANESSESFERQCAKIKGEVPRFNIPFENMRSAFVGYVVVNSVKDVHTQSDQDLPLPLRERIQKLAKPEYRAYVDGAIGVRKEIAAQATANAYKGLSENAQKLYMLHSQCYVLGVSNEKSDAYSDAMKALNETISLVEYKVYESEVAEAARQRQVEHQKAEDLRRHNAMLLQKELQSRRDNPSRSAKIGPFYVTASKCSASDVVDLGSHLITAPSGSKLFVIEGAFRNISNEGQLILPGMILIKHSGETYRYDVFEVLSQDQFAIPDQPINPLITQKVRIVYRVPDDVFGRVRWQPGRNPDRLTVDCGSI